MAGEGELILNHMSNTRFAPYNEWAKYNMNGKRGERNILPRV